MRNLTSGYQLLYSLKGRSSGNYPAAGVIDVGGTLYGTTMLGNAYGLCRKKDADCGTVFSITMSGREKVLHSFGKGTDGSEPQADLIDVKGTLYGTTTNGGAFGSRDVCGGGSNCGTVFSVTTSGTERVLHSFGNGNDGINPLAGLINISGVLYGTTAAGGRFGGGTVFSVATSGKEKVLYSFGNDQNDSSAPVAGLIDVNGTLYGTTAGGGAYRCGQYKVDGCGTVFSITTSGKEKVLHSFGKGKDGSDPVAGLINVGGMLYGTTASGGEYGGGTVFSVTPHGTEKVLHSFGNRNDGWGPLAALTDVGVTLYGTTEFGGSCPASSNGCGTIFSITTGGREKVLHVFGKGIDGGWPSADMSYKDGRLFGTTSGGGICKFNPYGCGTVFSLTP